MVLEFETWAFIACHSDSRGLSIYTGVIVSIWQRNALGWYRSAEKRCLSTSCALVLTTKYFPCPALNGLWWFWNELKSFNIDKSQMTFEFWHGALNWLLSEFAAAQFETLTSYFKNLHHSALQKGEVYQNLKNILHGNEINAKRSKVNCNSGLGYGIGRRDELLPSFHEPVEVPQLGNWRLISVTVHLGWPLSRCCFTFCSKAANSIVASAPKIPNSWARWFLTFIACWTMQWF